jgi:hypothetical protein
MEQTKIIHLSKIRIVKIQEKPIQEQPNRVTENIFAAKDSVITLEYDPKHAPIIRAFIGV